MNNRPKTIRPLDFACFLAWLDPDPTRAGEYYNDFQRRLTLYFAGRGCGTWAGELAAWTLDRVAEKFVDGGGIEAREPGSYVFQVARFVLLEHWKKPPLEPLVPNSMSTVLQGADTAKTDCCRQCLAKLGLDEQNLVQDYYLGQKEGEAKRLRGEMTADSGLRQGTLRVRVFRLKQKLLRCVTECLHGLPGNLP